MNMARNEKEEEKRQGEEIEMDEKQYWKKTDEIEIDLLDLMRGFLGQWKQILVVAIVGAVLAGGYSYVKSRNAQSVLPVVQEGAKGDGADSLENIELTEEEQQAVEAAALLQAEITALEDYIENSIRMKMDPYHKNRALLLYSIEDADRQTLRKAQECYSGFLSGGGVADALKKIDKSFQDLDSIYLAELISVSQVSDSESKLITDEQKQDGLKLFYVEVSGEDEKMTKRMSEDMSDALESYIPTVKKICGDHKLKLLTSSHSVRIDNDLQTWQQDRRNLLSTDRTNLKTATDAMTDQQMAVLNLKSNVKKDEEEPKEQETVKASAGISKKYVLIGLIAGVFFYACIYGCWYIFRKDVRTPGEFKSYYTIPLLGSVVTGSRLKERGVKAVLGLSGSKWTGAGQADMRQQTAQMLGRIRLVCEKQEIKKLCLAVEFPLEGKEKELLSQTAKQLQDWGIQTVTAENLSGDVSQWDKLEGEDAMILFCRSGVTTHQSVDHVMEIVSDNKIQAAGAVVLE